MTATVFHLPRARVDVAGQDDDDDAGGWEDRADDVLDELEALLAAGRVDQVIEFCGRAAGYLERSAVDLTDDGEALGRLTARLRRIRISAMAGVPTAGRPA